MIFAAFAWTSQLIPHSFLAGIKLRALIARGDYTGTVPARYVVSPSLMCCRPSWPARDRHEHRKRQHVALAQGQRWRSISTFAWLNGRKNYSRWSLARWRDSGLSPPSRVQPQVLGGSSEHPGGIVCCVDGDILTVSVLEDLQP